MVERTEHTVEVEGLPKSADGTRIVQLTDIHRSKMTRDRMLHRAVATANSAQGDVIVLTGDYVTDQAADIDPCAHILAPLRARLGVYAILGNHDHSTDAVAMERALARNHFTVLKNENVTLGNGLRIVGIEDDRYGHTNVERSFQGIPKDAFSFVLLHNPSIVERIDERTCVAVAGHTHGGQLRLPWVTNWAVRKIGAKHYHAGWYTVGKARLYVNRGLGSVGVPLRYGSRPEVAVFTLRAASS